MDHFTAVVEIFQVDRETEVTEVTNLRTRRVPGEQPWRKIKQKIEVARIVVRADTLEELKSKIAKHVAII